MAKRKILIIEDDFDILENITTLLEAENYEVVTCNDGIKGIVFAENLRPDLIICDIMMPDFDGYEVLEELNKKNITPLTPFIFLTAKVEKSDLRKGMNLGSDDYIFKPYTAQELLKSIEIRLSKCDIVKTKVLEDDEKSSKTDGKKRYKEGDNILFKIHTSKEFIKIERIKYILAENQYTNVVLDDNRHILVRKSLNIWEQLLPDNLFTRIHRSVIININYINKIQKLVNNLYSLSLKNCSSVFSISRRYSKILKDRI